MDETQEMMLFFGYEHLPPHMQSVSRGFCELARSIIDPQSTLFVPRNRERTVALRKLLEAKDSAVRAVHLAQSTWSASSSSGG